ncbi:L-lactate dehydrogenase [Feifania hominis]|uniref:L-lactate dehydrogenase n=1 Tax=Feifania hominis TaxID=2763660 RepID=A0A926HUE7_9FIRM|nr:L-lactate dehydrogenase [Feifania hominis]MBC8535476.1 L-lactate dehydrogenase [Feifania hominis]
MTVNRSKVVIVGAGNVGSTIAFNLVIAGVCDEVMLLDVNAEKARGEVLDLRHCVEYASRNIRVKTGSYADCSDADIVVITASAPRGGTIDRLEMLGATAKIVGDIVTPIMASGFNGHFIVISNPVDVMAYYVWRLSGLPKNQVIGTGTALDSARLKTLIGELMNIDPRSVQGYTMGEHGDSQMIPWSHVTVGGKSFLEIVADDRARFGEVDLEGLLSRTVRSGFEVLSRKGNTQFGIAGATVGIIKAILFDENRMIPVSTLLDGEYGESDVFCGVPAILNRTGVKEIGEFHLTPEELRRFHASADIIRQAIASLPPEGGASL